MNQPNNTHYETAYRYYFGLTSLKVNHKEVEEFEFKNCTLRVGDYIRFYCLNDEETLFRTELNDIYDVIKDGDTLTFTNWEDPDGVNACIRISGHLFIVDEFGAANLFMSR